MSEQQTQLPSSTRPGCICGARGGFPHSYACDLDWAKRAIASRIQRDIVHGTDSEPELHEDSPSHPVSATGKKRDAVGIDGAGSSVGSTRERAGVAPPPAIELGDGAGARAEGAPSPDPELHDPRICEYDGGPCNDIMGGSMCRCLCQCEGQMDHRRGPNCPPLPEPKLPVRQTAADGTVWETGEDGISRNVESSRTTPLHPVREENGQKVVVRLPSDPYGKTIESPQPVKKKDPMPLRLEVAGELITAAMNWYDTESKEDEESAVYRLWKACDAYRESVE